MGGFDPDQRYCQDIELWRRVAWRHQINQVDEALVRYRRHPVTMSRNWALISLYGLRYFVKMRRDTPHDLRSTLPSPATVAYRWLLRTLMPQWLRQPRKQWVALRPRMQAAMAAIAGAFGL